MNEGEDAAPALPNDRSASPAVWQAGCVIACAPALLPILYVGSFAYLYFDDAYDRGLMDSLDERTVDALSAFYSPLIWLCEEIFGW